MVVILVVSGETRIGRHVRSVLGSAGWWVTSASDREAALRAAADQEPALVIVDCEIEGAAELVRTFGSKNGGPGVLLLEPPGDVEGAFHAFEVGADQILSKPPRAKELIDAAERVISLPHQSAGGLAADRGDKLSAADIFGEVLMELDATESEAIRGREESVAGPEPSAEDPPGTEPSSDDELPPDGFSAELVEEPSAKTEPSAEDPLGTEPSSDDELQPDEGSAKLLEEPSAEVEFSTEVPTEADPPSEDELQPDEGSAELFGGAGPEQTGSSATLLGEQSASRAAPEEVVPKVDGEEDTPSVEIVEPETVETEMATKEPVREIAPEELLLSEPDEDQEVSSFSFDPKVLGEEVDQIERLVSDLVPQPEEPRPVVEPGIEPEPGTEDGAEETRAEPDSVSDVGEDEGSDAGPEQPDRLPEPASPPVTADKSRFGQYRLDERIAVGGMAEVWRASMLGMEGFRKTVAIKKILPHLAENSEFVAMFVEEAKLAAQLSHENLVEIYDLGKIGESFFIAMEYVDGKDLRELLNRLQQSSDQMPVGLALLVAAEVARGLEYAHTREDSQGNALGLVHRDVSPRNVLIGYDGRVRLCDFGVAKAVSSVIETQIGALKGKLQYMSPEQASGRPVDNRSDLYSLGSVLYEMIAGRRLYEADNEISLLDAVRAGNFADPRKHCPGLPQEVRRMVIKALAKKPSARYQSAGALEQDLRALLRTLEPMPGEQALSTFVRDLFTERAAAEEPAVRDDGTGRSAVTETLEGPDAVTKSLPVSKFLVGSRAARFWWGVAAGLLAAGLVATLLKLVLG